MKEELAKIFSMTQKLHTLFLKTKLTFGGKGDHGVGIGRMNKPLRNAIEAFWEQHDYEKVEHCKMKRVNKFLAEKRELLDNAFFWKPINNQSVNEQTWKLTEFEVIDRKNLGKGKTLQSPMQSVLQKMRTNSTQSDSIDHPMHLRRQSTNNTVTTSTILNGGASGTDRGINPQYNSMATNYVAHLTMEDLEEDRDVSELLKGINLNSMKKTQSQLNSQHAASKAFLQRDSTG